MLSRVSCAIVNTVPQQAARHLHTNLTSSSSGIYNTSHTTLNVTDLLSKYFMKGQRSEGLTNIASKASKTRSEQTSANKDFPHILQDSGFLQQHVSKQQKEDVWSRIFYSIEVPKTYKPTWTS